MISGYIILENDDIIDLNDIQEIYVNNNSSESYYFEQTNGTKTLVLGDENMLKTVKEIKEHNIKSSKTKEIDLTELQRIY